MEIIELENIDSTNHYAKTNIDSLNDKTVILAKRQTNGRGRLNRSWVDLGEGNLFMSIVLKPSNSFQEFYPNLTQYLSLSLCKVLEKFDLKPRIKWPNDVLIDGKKIAGILSETVIQGNNFKGIILGIGVNLNARENDVKKIQNKLVTSLNLELGKIIEVKEFSNLLLNEFFDNYNQFKELGFEQIKEDYIKRNCFLNKDLTVQTFNKEEKGLAKEINHKGELVLLKENNKELVLTIGDIL